MKASITYPTYVHDLVEGVSKNVHSLREHLVERGVDATDDSPRVQMRDMNRKTVYVKQGVAAFHRVRRALSSADTDLVHYHVSIPGMAAWAALAKRSARTSKPLVLHMWNPWYAKADVHTDAGREVLYHKLFNGSLTTTPFLDAFDRIVVSSQYQAEQLAARGYEDVDIIPNGVDLQRYQPAPGDDTRRNARRELGLSPDATLLLYYGHLTPWKGVHVLTEALPKAFEDNEDARLVVARTHYGDAERRLRDRMRELGVLDRVDFLGLTEVPLLLQAVDAGVVPATAAVGTACHPNVVLEYHSAGLPIVASRVGSIPEAVRHGETGLLAAPGDPDDLGARLQELLRDASLRRRLGAGARRRAENAYDWHSVARSYEALYASL